jgi:hypothetical protein
MMSLHTFLFKKNKGFILLFTVVVISVTVGLSTALIITAKRQSQLGALQSETQGAFYAADMGLECGFAWYYQEDEQNAPFVCGGVTLTNTPPGTNERRIYHFNFENYYDSSSIAWTAVAPCGVVIITQASASYPILVEGVSHTDGYSIESYGYSMCAIDETSGQMRPLVNDPALVERKLYAAVANYSS